MVVYFREKYVSIFGEASTHTDVQLKGPARLAVSKRKIKLNKLQDWKRLPGVNLIGYQVVELEAPSEGVMRGTTVYY